MLLISESPMTTTVFDDLSCLFCRALQPHQVGKNQYIDQKRVREIYISYPKLLVITFEVNFIQSGGVKKVNLKKLGLGTVLNVSRQEREIDQKHFLVVPNGTKFDNWEMQESREKT